eukprot:1349207-Rhodomonas_salina.2
MVSAWCTAGCCSASWHHQRDLPPRVTSDWKHTGEGPEVTRGTHHDPPRTNPASHSQASSERAPTWPTLDPGGHCKHGEEPSTAL